jgi:fumarate hydratase class II
VSGTRIERDSMGELRVPAHALWGASTERARLNFAYGERPLPRSLWHALGLLKGALARVHGELGLLDAEKADAIAAAADELAAGALDEHCVIGVFQTGSGTSSNMNCNEVLANRAAERLGHARGSGAVHPNDDVNLGQSSNDVFPSALQLALARDAQRELLPELARLAASFHALADAQFPVVKTARTHLMDAMPIRLGQEFRGYAQQIERGAARIAGATEALCELPLGGTAVGTGVNADERVAPRVLAALSRALELPLRTSTAPFQAQAALDHAVAFGAALRGLATALYKLTNDLRWLASGPLAGLDEIRLPALQPGSSIMPAKVNPVVCEGVLMACAPRARPRRGDRVREHAGAVRTAHDDAARRRAGARGARAAPRCRAQSAGEGRSTACASPRGSRRASNATRSSPPRSRRGSATTPRRASRRPRSRADAACTRSLASRPASTRRPWRPLLDPARLAGERGRTREG